MLGCNEPLQSPRTWGLGWGRDERRTLGPELELPKLWDSKGRMEVMSGSGRLEEVRVAVRSWDGSHTPCSEGEKRGSGWRKSPSAAQGLMKKPTAAATVWGSPWSLSWTSPDADLEPRTRAPDLQTPPPRPPQGLGGEDDWETEWQRHRQRERESVEGG